MPFRLDELLFLKHLPRTLPLTPTAFADHSHLCLASPVVVKYALATLDVG